MSWWIKLLVPVALSVIEKYAVPYVEQRFAKEANLIQEIVAFVDAHVRGGSSPSSNLAGAAERFDALERLTP